MLMQPFFFLSFDFFFYAFLSPKFEKSYKRAIFYQIFSHLFKNLFTLLILNKLRLLFLNCNNEGTEWATRHIQCFILLISKNIWVIFFKNCAVTLFRLKCILHGNMRWIRYNLCFQNNYSQIKLTFGIFGCLSSLSWYSMESNGFSY